MSDVRKWDTERDNSTLPYVVVLFSSRNKDNADVENFKPRRKARLRTRNMDSILRDFYHFARNGCVGEMSRLYISVNARDINKVRKQLIHELIDEEDFNFTYIDSKLASIGAKKECALEKKWMFDFDVDDMAELGKFIDDIKQIDNEVMYEIHKTPHGYAVITNRGFDTRTLLFDKWKDKVTVMRDDLLCYSWWTKNE